MTIKLSGPSRLPINQQKPDKLVIFLHGVGSDGHDLMGLSDEFAQTFPKAVFLSPNAPFVYENYPVGYQWFSLSDYSPDKLYSGIKDALPILKAYIDENLQNYNLSYNDLVLIGFSQGAMMALQVALRLPESCFAVIAFSGALIKPKELEKEVKSQPPICLIHGKDDMVVPASSHILSVKVLEKMRVKFQEHLIPNLGHSINMKAIALAKDFLVSIVL